MTTEFKGIVTWIVIIFIAWLVLTGCFWLFWEKTTYTQVCHDAIYPVFCWYNNETPCEDYHYNRCYTNEVKSYYTVNEVITLEASWFGYQWSWWSPQPANFIEWLMKHPIVEEKIENEPNNTVNVIVTPERVYPVYPFTYSDYTEKYNRTEPDLNISTCTSWSYLRDGAGRQGW